MVDKRSRKAVNVHIVTNNTIHVTRKEILTWIGDLVCKDLRRVEDLSNGSIYCIVMNKLFPGCVPFQKVRLNTKSESEAVSNYRLLSNAFRDLEVRKDIPVDSLVKGVFSDNFRFAQWFKLFYDANSSRSQMFHPVEEFLYDSSPHVGQPPRRSLSVNSKDSCRFKSHTSPAGDNVHCRTRPPPIPTLNNTRQLDGGESRAKTSLNQSARMTPENAEQEVNKNEMEAPEDLSDVISIGPSEASTSEVYQLPESLKKTTSTLQKPDSTSQNTANASPSSNQEKPTTTHFMEPGNRQQLSQSSPCPRRRTEASHPPRASDLRLPPPYPSPPHQHPAMSNRWSHNFTVNHPCYSPQSHPYLQAAGDRPTSKLSNSSDAFPRDNFPNSEARLLHKSENLREPLPPNSEREIPKPPLYATTCNGTSCKNETQRCTHTRSSTTNASGRMKPTSTSNMLSMRELQMNQLISSEVAGESELQRELAMLRYGTIEQRRALFFCQKEAQFYFNKLRRIEDLCYRLKEIRAKSRDNILETIFGILYETEEGFVCQDEIEA